MGRHGSRAAILAVLSILLLALAAQGALAAVEVGDAGDLPLTAQEPGPAGQLTSISGSNAGFGERDMYKICLTGVMPFSASTIGGAGFDTQLFLFDSNGIGVYGNDDGIDPQGRLSQQSSLPAGHALTPQAAGVYYLAISSFNWDPQSAGGSIFPKSSLSGPDPAAGALPIIGWATPDTSKRGDMYTIALTGTRSCVDTTAPTIDLRRPAENAVYVRDQEVTADYSCADEPDGSGLATCTGTKAAGEPIDTSTIGTHTFMVTATDRRGNTTTVTHSYTVLDDTDPTVQLDVPADGAEYARGATVNADYACFDEQGGSGVASCTGTKAAGEPIDTSTLGSHTFTVTAVDHAGNSTTVTHTYRVVDETAPNVSLVTPADGATYAQGADVPAEYSCVDEPGGSGVTSCDAPVAPGDDIDTSTPGLHTFTVTGTDAAGNSTTVTHSYTVADRTPPAIDLRTPEDGAAYVLGQIVLADYDCDNGAAPVCVGDVPDGAPIDTATAGEHTFTVRSRDGAGNEGTETATYVVDQRPDFGFHGFLWPVLNRPRVNVVKAGWIVPMRFNLDRFRGFDVIAPGYPRSRRYKCGTNLDLDNGTATVGIGGRHRGLHYRRRGNVYTYLWKTDPAWAGQCRHFILKLADGRYHRADFLFPALRRH